MRFSSGPRFGGADRARRDRRGVGEIRRMCPRAASGAVDGAAGTRPSSRRYKALDVPTRTTAASPSTSRFSTAPNRQDITPLRVTECNPTDRDRRSHKPRLVCGPGVRLRGPFVASRQQPAERPGSRRHDHREYHPADNQSLRRRGVEEQGQKGQRCCEDAEVQGKPLAHPSDSGAVPRKDEPRIVLGWKRRGGSRVRLEQGRPMARGPRNANRVQTRMNPKRAKGLEPSTYGLGSRRSTN